MSLKKNMDTDERTDWESDEAIKTSSKNYS